MILLKNKNSKSKETTGTSIRIDDAYNSSLDFIKVDGKSTQATRSGKNLYNVNDTVATSDASISKSSTGFTATRTSTSSLDLFVASHTKTLKANTTYTFYEKRTNSSTCYFYSDNLFGTSLTRNIIKSTEDLIIYTFVTDSTGKVVIGFYSVNQAQGDTITLSNIMILEGEYSSENIPDYELYGVMPSSNYPSPIESIAEISATVTGKNIFNKNNYSDLMIVVNDAINNYEEYKSNSLTIDLQGNELCSLSNGTKDEVGITSGKSLIVKRTKEFILDENKTIVLEKALTNTTRFLIYNVTSSMNDYPSAISTHFKYLVDYNSDTEHFYITKNGAMYLFINKSIASTVDELKTWLSKNNVKFLHELEEPETINLGEVVMPYTYKGINNISNSANTNMSIKYYSIFQFDKILRSGYEIDEQEKEIAKKQMANGHRKKIVSSYVDCIIKINLGLLDNETYQLYKEQLVDGEYEYWSYRDNKMKNANFIITLPSISTEYAYDDDIGIDDLKIILEKSSDINVES